MVRLAASDADEAILVRNLTTAYKVSDWFAEKRHLDLWDVRDVMTTMLVTESGGGFIYANDGQGFREPDSVVNQTPWNWNPQTNKPIGTPEQRAEMRAILRKSLDLPHDKVGSNGRSTGPAQQLSAETGGAWGPLAATMRVDLAVLAFLDAVDWSDRSPLYLGKPMANWQTAMLLRVQRPLPSEVATNYGAAQLARAQAIARDERFTPAQDDGWVLNMADQQALDKYRGEIVNDLKPCAITFYDQIGGSHFVAYPNGTYIQVPNPMGDDGVLAAHLGHLEKMGHKVVDIGAADPFMFGHRIEWSDRPAGTTAY